MKIIVIAFCLISSLVCQGQKKALQKTSNDRDSLEMQIKKLQEESREFHRKYNELQAQYELLKDAQPSQKPESLLNDSFAWKDLIAIYAGIISTIVALITVVKYRREVRNKLAIRFKIQSRAYTWPDHIGEWFRVFHIQVVNHSHSDKFIQQPTFQVSNLKQGFVAINMVNPITYPIKLTSGEQWEIAVDFESIKETLIKSGAKKCRVEITDTLGKSFRSNWLRVKDL